MIEGNGPNFVMAETSKLQFPLKDIINTMGRIIQRAIKEEKKKKKKNYIFRDIELEKSERKRRKKLKKFDVYNYILELMGHTQSSLQAIFCELRKGCFNGWKNLKDQNGAEKTRHF